MVVSGNQVDDVIRGLYANLKRPVSIYEVASVLGVSPNEIRGIVEEHLRLHLIEGTELSLEPGLTMGLID